MMSNVISKGRVLSSLLAFCFLPMALFSQVFYDGFESGTYTPTWIDGVGPYSNTVTATNPAVGTYRLEMIGGGSHFTGMYTNFTSSQPNYVTWRAMTTTTSSALDYFAIGDSQTSSNFGAVLAHFNDDGTLRFIGQSSLYYTTPVVPNVWYDIEVMNIDWVNKEFDIYIDGVLHYTDFPFLSQSTNDMSQIHMYNFHSGTAYVDEISVSGIPPCTTPPTAICQNLTTYLNGAGSSTIAASDLDGGSLDNCGTPGLTFSASQTTFTCADLSGVPVTLTVSDGNLNTATCVANVTVLDTISPTASQPAPITVQCLGDVPAVDPLIFTDEADNCATPTVAFVSEVSDGLSCPETLTRTYSITDASGNGIMVDHIIVINDITPPVASNPAPIDIECVGDVPAPDVNVVVGESDNCTVAPTVSWVNDVSDNGTCPEIITRTYSVTDDCGNFVFVDQTITILDVTPPVPNATLMAINGNCDVTPTAPIATDNCSGSIAGVENVVFPITAIGTTTVTWTYSDACGNQTTQTQDVIISPLDVTTSLSGITITANNGNASYQWIDCSNNTPISGATSQAFEPTVNGDYAVIVAENGCSDTSACTTISDVSLGELHIATLSLYPNPTSGTFNVNFEGNIQNIALFDMTGRRVQVPTDLIEKSIDGSQLNPGKYIVQITTMDDQTIQGTVVIQN